MNKVAQLEADRLVIAEQLWEGADLPPPLNEHGVKTEWIKRCFQSGKLLPATWKRSFYNCHTKRYELFFIKWNGKSTEVKFCCLK